MYNVNFIEILQNSGYDFSDLDLTKKLPDAEAKLLERTTQALRTLLGVYSKLEEQLEFEDSKVLFDTFFHLQYIVICRAYFILVSNQQVIPLKLVDCFHGKKGGNKFSIPIVQFLNYLEQLYVKFNEGTTTGHERVQAGWSEVSQIYSIDGEIRKVENNSLINEVINCLRKSAWTSAKPRIYFYNLYLFFNIIMTGTPKNGTPKNFFGFLCEDIVKSFQAESIAFKNISNYFREGGNLLILPSVTSSVNNFFLSMPIVQLTYNVAIPLFIAGKSVVIGFPQDFQHVIQEKPKQAIEVGTYKPSTFQRLEYDFTLIFKNTQFGLASSGLAILPEFLEVAKLPEIEIAEQLANFISLACAKLYSFYLNVKKISTSHLNSSEKIILLNTVFHLQYAVLWRVSLSINIKSAELQIISRYVEVTSGGAVINYPFDKAFRFLSKLYAKQGDKSDELSLIAIINKSIGNILRQPGFQVDTSRVTPARSLLEKCIELCKSENLNSPEWKVPHYAIYIYNLMIFGSIWIAAFRRDTTNEKNNIKTHFFDFPCEQLYLWFGSNFSTLFGFLNAAAKNTEILEQIGCSGAEFLTNVLQRTLPPTPPSASTKPRISPPHASSSSSLTPPSLATEAANPVYSVPYQIPQARKPLPPPIAPKSVEKKATVKPVPPPKPAHLQIKPRQ